MKDDRRIPALLTLLALFLGTVPAAAENWPHWRGPSHDGISSAEAVPAEWSREENVRWRLDLPGPAQSTPIVWGEKIFLTSAEGDDLLLLAVDTSGKVLWRREIDDGNYDARQGEGSAASPSPSTDGERIYVFLGTGLLAAYDFAGEELWRTELREKYGPFKTFFGVSSTPLLHGDRLYLQILHTDGQLVLAYDKATGEEVWRHERVTDARDENLHSYASPVVFRSGETEQLIIHGGDYTTGHALADGREIWRVGDLNPKDNYNSYLRFVATPLATRGLLVVPTAKNGPVLGLDPTGAKGVITGKEAFYRWRLPRNTPDVPSPLIHDGVLYLSRENGILHAYDAESGELLYEERVHGSPHRGSPVYADGKVFLMGMDGTVSVVRAGREYELLAQNDMDERLAASLAVAAGTVYLRTYEALYAIAPKAAAEGGAGEVAESR